MTVTAAATIASKQLTQQKDPSKGDLNGESGTEAGRFLHFWHHGAGEVRPAQGPPNLVAPELDGLGEDQPHGARYPGVLMRGEQDGGAGEPTVFRCPGVFTQLEEDCTKCTEN